MASVARRSQLRWLTGQAVFREAANDRLLPSLADASSGVSGRVGLDPGEVHAVSIVDEPVEVMEAGSGAFERYLPFHWRMK
jgi:hypothetical protein